MKRLLAVVAALFLLSACASTGAQTVAGMPHGPDKALRGGPHVVAADVAGASQCYGDGQDGPRVQAVYLVADNRADRYATIASSIRTWAANMDQAVNDSAALQGGTAHIRWACTGGVVDVLHVNVAAAEDDTFTATRTALKGRGYNRTDRKYLLWADTTDGSYCGISQTYSSIDAAPSYGQVNVGCWGQTASVELHELMHGFGAVRLSAPNSNGSWHCTDEYSRMCYPDGTSTKPMVYYPDCPASYERLLDCHADDFASWKAGDPLAGNVANSTYLVSTFGLGAPSPTPSPTSPTVSPTSTVSPPPSPSPTPKPCGKSHRPGCR